MAISKMKLPTKMRKKASGKHQVFSSGKGKGVENRKDNQREKKNQRKRKRKRKKRIKEEIYVKMTPIKADENEKMKETDLQRERKKKFRAHLM